MSHLPVNWVTASVLEIADLVRGVTYTKADACDVAFAGSIPVLRANNIQDRAFDLNDLVHVPSSVVSSAQRITKGDVVVATSSGSISVVGKAAQASQDMNAGFGAFCGLLRPSTEVDAKYFGHYFSSHAYRTAVSTMARGVNINNLKRDHFQALRLPLAPLSEQKRIVDKLDAVLARVDTCRDRLDRIPALLRRFRQSVLAAATSGKLTANWNGGDTSEWQYERAADVCDKVQSGGTPKEGFSEDGIAFLKVYNIVDQKVAFDYRPQYIAEAIHNGSMRKSKAKPGDVLMNIVGPPLGKVAIVPDTQPTWNINQAITLFRPSARISTGWLYCILCGGENIAEIVHETRGSAGQSNISLSQCRDFVFPVPPMKEQTEIVRRVEALFAYVDRLEARYAAARAQVDKLTPATLAKAFRGELVSQDTNDEPANALLERIAAARAGTDSARRPRTKSTVRKEPLPS